MPLRIGFDMDGVLADLASAYRDVERRLFGTIRGRAALDPDMQDTIGPPDEAAGAREAPAVNPATKTSSSRRRQAAVWNAIRTTPDFWESLHPLEEGAVRRLHAAMARHRWEVMFVTQRPSSSGATVQRQTQRWLVAQGFDLPSVLVLAGSRGAAIGALGLDYHADDNTQNCLDVIVDSCAKPILVVPDEDEVTIASARKLGIGTARSLSACLDILERASEARTEPSRLAQIAASVGWK